MSEFRENAPHAAAAKSLDESAMSEPPMNEPQVDWANLDLSKVPIKKEETDYCNEFQDNQTVYETIYENEPRTEEERKAQEEAMKQEAEEAKQDDKVLKGESVEIKMPRSEGDQKTDGDQAATGKKVELPFEFKYILKYTEKDDLERVKKCIERYPHSIDARDSDGYMPIHRACHNDNVELVKFLVDNGADVEAKTNEGWRPIHCAAYWGNIEVVSFLIKFGANINALTHGNNTCLHFAVQRYERKLLELLIYHPLMYLEVKNGSNDDAYELCKRKTENYELFHNLLNEDAY